VPGAKDTAKTQVSHRSMGIQVSSAPQVIFCFLKTALLLQHGSAVDMQQRYIRVVRKGLF